ncbi:MAG: ImmA/IrrE family metallo-endopeptidase [Rhodobacteraceae bacterium]|nr:ImmA/IrrE family metallo-endopeptidase [Paracoccaceae bacterium]
MPAAKNHYNPDYAVPPGWILEEILEARNLSQAEFARRCGRTPKLISEIIAGKAPIETETALQFGRATGIDAGIWQRMEASYRRHLALEDEAKIAEEWRKSFPIGELVKRGCFTKPESKIDAISKLLTFFGVGTIDGWNNRYGSMNVVYRHSQSFKSNEVALATWLRLGEIKAESQECADYNQGNFRKAAKTIRGLTKQPVEKIIHQTIESCNKAGVALVLTRQLPRTALSGAARWLSPRKAIIQLTARHKTDDHFWFSFFHEVAHILLHSKKEVFVEEVNINPNERAELEVEANEWASNFLVPKMAWEKYIYQGNFSKTAVLKFANDQEIPPSIIVGKLQHQGLVSYGSKLNKLKQKVDL